jgi:nitrogen fixation protein NifU and related proteins
MDIDELYQSIILDHSKRPRNFGELPPPATKGEGYNPACGDEVTVFVTEAPDHILEQIRFTGQACAICMASTSLMTTQFKGKSDADALKLKESFVQVLTTQAEPPKCLGNLLGLSGVKKFTQRLKCATHGWHAFSEALKNARD